MIVVKKQKIKLPRVDLSTSAKTLETLKQIET